MKQQLYLNQTRELETPLTKQLADGRFPLDRKGDIWSRPAWPENYKKMLQDVRDKIYRHFKVDQISRNYSDEFVYLMGSLFSAPVKIAFYVEGAPQGNTYNLKYVDQVPYVQPGYFNDDFLKQAFTPHSKIDGIDISSFPFGINNHVFLIELRGTNFLSKTNITVTDVIIAETCNDVKPHSTSNQTQQVVLGSVVQMLVGYSGGISPVKFCSPPTPVGDGLYEVDSKGARLHYSYITDNGVKLVGKCVDLAVMAYVRRYDPFQIAPLTFNSGVGYNKIVVIDRFNTTFGQIPIITKDANRYMKGLKGNQPDLDDISYFSPEIYCQYIYLPDSKGVTLSEYCVNIALDGTASGFVQKKSRVANKTIAAAAEKIALENAIDLEQAKQVRKIAVSKGNEMVDKIEILYDQLDIVKRKIRNNTKKMTLDVDEDDEDEVQAEDLKKLIVQAEAIEKKYRDDYDILTSFIKYGDQIPLQKLAEKYNVLRPSSHDVKALVAPPKKDRVVKKPQSTVVIDDESEEVEIEDEPEKIEIEKEDSQFGNPDIQLPVVQEQIQEENKENEIKVEEEKFVPLEMSYYSNSLDLELAMEAKRERNARPPERKNYKTKKAFEEALEKHYEIYGRPEASYEQESFQLDERPLTPLPLSPQYEYQHDYIDYENDIPYEPLNLIDDDVPLNPVDDPQVQQSAFQEEVQKAVEQAVEQVQEESVDRAQFIPIEKVRVEDLLAVKKPEPKKKRTKKAELKQKLAEEKAKQQEDIDTIVDQIMVVDKEREPELEPIPEKEPEPIPEKEPEPIPEKEPEPIPEKDAYEYNPEESDMVGDIWQNESDLKSSKELLQKILKQRTFSGTDTGVIDIAGGIGRVAQSLFVDIFKNIDIQDINPKLLAQARKNLGKNLRDTFQSSIDKHQFTTSYDLIWVQWGLCFIESDSVVSEFINRATEALVKNGKKTGRLVIIENIASQKDLILPDGKRTDRWVDPVEGFKGRFGVVRAESVWEDILTQSASVYQKIISTHKFTNDQKKTIKVNRVIFIVQPAKQRELPPEPAPVPVPEKKEEEKKQEDDKMNSSSDPSRLPSSYHSDRGHWRKSPPRWSDQGEEEQEEEQDEPMSPQTPDEEVRKRERNLDLAEDLIDILKEELNKKDKSKLYRLYIDGYGGNYRNLLLALRENRDTYFFVNQDKLYIALQQIKADVYKMMADGGRPIPTKLSFLQDEERIPEDKYTRPSLMGGSEILNHFFSGRILTPNVNSRGEIVTSGRRLQIVDEDADMDSDEDSDQQDVVDEPMGDEVDIVEEIKAADLPIFAPRQLRVGGDRNNLLEHIERLIIEARTRFTQRYSEQYHRVPMARRQPMVGLITKHALLSARRGLTDNHPVDSYVNVAVKIEMDSQRKSRFFSGYLKIMINRLAEMTLQDLFDEISNQLAELTRSVSEMYEEDEETFIFIVKPTIWYLSEAPMQNHTKALAKIANKVSQIIYTRDAFMNFHDTRSLANRLFLASSIQWTDKLASSDYYVQSHYMHDTQFYMLSVMAEAGKDKLWLKDRTCLQLIAEAILMHEHCNLPEAKAFAEGGNRYVSCLQEARLIVPADKISGDQMIRQRNLQVQKYKTSTQFCLNNRSISEFVKNFSHVSFDEMFKNYMELTKFLHVGKKYTALTTAASHGNIAKTVEQLNAILAFKQVTVYYTYINTVIECIGSEPTESLHNLDIQLRLNQPQANLDNPRQFIKSTDYVIIGHDQHAFIYTYSQLPKFFEQINCYTEYMMHSKTVSFQMKPQLEKHSLNMDSVVLEYHTKNPDRSGKYNQDLHDILQTHMHKQIKIVNELRATGFDYNKQCTVDLRSSEIDSLGEQKKRQCLQNFSAMKLQCQLDGQDSSKLKTSNFLSQHIYNEAQIYENIYYGDNVPFNKFVQRQREQFVTRIGILAMDCETYVDDIDPESHSHDRGNQKVWVVTLYGHAVSLKQPIGSPMIQVDKRFVGTEPMLQMVEYMKEEGILIDMQCETQTLNYLMYQKVMQDNPVNVVYAHNGMKFDYRLMMESLQSAYSQVSTVGDFQNMKQIVTPSCFFMDSLMLIQGSLKSIAKSFADPAFARFTEERCLSPHEQAMLARFKQRYPTKESFGKMECDDIIGYTSSQYAIDQSSPEGVAKINRMIDYCTQDSAVLYYIIYTFIDQTYSQQFYRVDQYDCYNTFSFIGKVFPFSAASLAMDIFKTIYNKFTLRPNKSAFPHEKDSYMGGLTIVLRTLLILGFALDINSSYPAAMMNLMPTFHLSHDQFRNGFRYKNIAMDKQDQQYYLNYNVVADVRYAVDTSQGVDSFYEYKGHQYKIIPYCMYQIFFKVRREEDFENKQKGCFMSTLIHRSALGDSIIETAQVTENDRDYNDKTKCIEGVWQWGINILTMLQQDYLDLLTINKAILYQGEPIYREFIKEMYDKRLDAKKRGDKVMDLLCKISMNSSYGKNGQKAVPKTITGDAMRIIEELQYMTSVNDGRHIDFTRVKMYAVNSDDLSTADLSGYTTNVNVHNRVKTSIHQVSILPRPEDQLMQIGCLVRFASYISNIGRVQLVNGMNAIHNEFNKGQPEDPKIHICYGDTDSVYIDCYEYWLKELEEDPELHDDIIGKVKAWQEISSLQLTKTSFDETTQLIFSQVAAAFKQSRVYQRMHEVKIFDPVNIHTFNKVDMINDDGLLGRFKIERLTLGGRFTAPKQYTMLSQEGKGKSELVVKGKGIRSAAILANPSAIVTQHTSFVEMSTFFHQLIYQHSNYVTQLSNDYYLGKKSLRQCVDSIKTVAKEHMRDIDQDPTFAVFKEKMRCFAQQMICLFVNQNSFQSHGACVTILNVMKGVTPSTSKRMLDIEQSLAYNLCQTMAPGGLFDYEVNRAIQNQLIKELRKIQAESEEGKLFREQYEAQNKQQLTTVRLTMRRHMQAQKQANAITKHIKLISSFVNQSSQKQKLVDSIFTQSTQWVNVQQLLISFHNMVQFTVNDHQYRVTELKSTGHNDFLATFSFLLEQTHSCWARNLNHRTYKMLVKILCPTELTEDELTYEQYKYNAALIMLSFAEVFKLKCVQVNNFLDVVNKINSTFSVNDLQFLKVKSKAKLDVLPNGFYTKGGTDLMQELMTSVQILCNSVILQTDHTSNRTVSVQVFDMVVTCCKQINDLTMNSFCSPSHKAQLQSIQDTFVNAQSSDKVKTDFFAFQVVVATRLLDHLDDYIIDIGDDYNPYVAKNMAVQEFIRANKTLQAQSKEIKEKITFNSDKGLSAGVANKLVESLKAERNLRSKEIKEVESQLAEIEQEPADDYISRYNIDE